MAVSDRGFASMNREKQKAIASQGGKAAHKQGRAHVWDSAAAAEAGRKGGLKSAERRKAQLEKMRQEQEDTPV